MQPDVGSLLAFETAGLITYLFTIAFVRSFSAGDAVFVPDGAAANSTRFSPFRKVFLRVSTLASRGRPFFRLYHSDHHVGLNMWI